MRTDIKFLWFIYLSQSTQSKVRDFHIALRIQKQVLGLYNEFKNLIPRKKLENVWKLVSLWPWDLCDKLLCCGNSPPHQSIVGRASLPRPHRTFPRKTAKNNTFLRISTSEKKKIPTAPSWLILQQLQTSSPICPRVTPTTLPPSLCISSFLSQ